jgi:hypothetical protein
MKATKKETMMNKGKKSELGLGGLKDYSIIKKTKKKSYNPPILKILMQTIYETRRSYS